MAETKEQNFQNHTRFDPAFHFFMVPVFLINLIVALVHVVRFPSWGAGWMAVVALAALVAVFKIRLYALRAQDRVIRLEERLRMSSLLSDPLRSRVPELTESQLVALRFAGDGELPEAVERTLAGKLKVKEIKQSVRTWRPDHFRI